jgi:hypothetical protein
MVQLALIYALTFVKLDAAKTQVNSEKNWRVNITLASCYFYIFCKKLFNFH